MSVALEATGLAKRYGRTWALRDCTLAVPEGRVASQFLLQLGIAFDVY